MGREVRKVAKDWEHPKDERTGKFIPLFQGYAEAKRSFEAMQAEDGLQAALDWHGRAPNTEDYMPDWPEAERVRFMMYEDTSEGTPISPAFDTPEELARWLVDNGASAFASMTADYEHWLRVARGGFAPSAVMTNGVMESGVQAFDPVSTP